ncbi:hypothetical protein AB4163_23350, partial [Vibrio splendidus]
LTSIFIDNATPIPEIPPVGLWHRQRNLNLNLVGVNISFNIHCSETPIPKIPRVGALASAT